ncbi:ABC transporter ATP-binding protein [Clostridium scatologenes]|uniref:ABC transporter n=1 Tax=Clostridium scatologenes TaxID=1548 RepID=A0A0E3M5G3_CLOSL|nr:ABC transporter ATP-binding protein [Clostridium scatologenes]AKA68409.1 ABC transporter [Clostridium scatologenes]
MIVLQVENLVKKYGKFTAINDISFELTEGKIIGLIGPNGAGKTTTLKCITGLLKSNAGRVLIMDKCIRDKEARSNIAYIPETPDIYGMLTVWEHLKFIALAYNLKNWEVHAEELLQKFDLKDKRNDLCKNLSKGMTQKVSICSNLLHDPQVILVDEPMIGLDPKAIRELKDAFKTLKEEGKTVFISTHLLDNAQNLCDEVIVMKKGKIIAKGSLEELRKDFNAGKDVTLEDLFLEVTEDEKN